MANVSLVPAFSVDAGGAKAEETPLVTKALRDVSAKIKPTIENPLQMVKLSLMFVRLILLAYFSISADVKEGDYVDFILVSRIFPLLRS